MCSPHDVRRIGVTDGNRKWALSSVYTQAWLAKDLQHDPAADDVLLGTSLSYLEPTPPGRGGR
ncbi:hypothetical protein [Blastococcus brunescens]|uniref:Uncharacterized protein n=1 Tax=Blastococcus brunescens TaxID=1564165 RepID=A0ABZ1B010_9ACTN|nr:hypothetical protein [Blastococcus sp. BMG 8361]WRL62395.1 hypothetical protein U6N30_20540 [Blastococcus sp. BMG 8361]